MQRCRYSLPQTRLVVLILLCPPQCLCNDNRQLSVPIPLFLPPLQAGISNLSSRAVRCCMRELQNKANMQRACPLKPNANSTSSNKAATCCALLAISFAHSHTHTHIYANVERSIIKLDLAADLASILSLNFSHENFELKFCASSKNKFY